VKAAEARRLVRDLGVEDDVKRAVADSPPLSERQIARLRSIFGGTPNANDAGPSSTDAAATTPSTGPPAKEGRVVLES
jgi:hypothetical protein